MLKRSAATALILALVAVVLVPSLGCSKARQKRTGTLKEWIVGDWARQDDPNWWSFNASGEMTTTGRLPISGTYTAEEPDKIEIIISGAGAFSASTMLGVPVNPENKNLYLHMVVEDDEMRPSGIKSETVFRKK